MKSRYIKNPNTGVVFSWTEVLANRRDFIECNAEGVPLGGLPQPEVLQKTETSAEENPTPAAKDKSEVEDGDLYKHTEPVLPRPRGQKRVPNDPTSPYFNINRASRAGMRLYCEHHGLVYNDVPGKAGLWSIRKDIKAQAADKGIEL